MRKKNVCPICGYKFKLCQCKFGGSTHPDRSKNQEVVSEHIYLLSIRQIIHVMKLQKYWCTSYGDYNKETLLDNLKKYGTTEL